MQVVHEEYLALLRGFGKLELLASAIKTAAARERGVQLESKKNMAAAGVGDIPVSGHNMAYRALRTGSPVFYGYHEQSVDEVLEYLVIYTNKQYQWVLVEAFEYFEDFVEVCYAHLGFKKPSAWSPKDLKEMPPSAIDDYGWFLDQAQKKKKGGIHAKLNLFRSALPGFSVLEANNAHRVDFRFSIPLIEHLRHVVVHNGGRVRDERKFADRVFSAAGIQNNGKFDEEKLKELRYFLARQQHGVEVNLLESPLSSSGQPYFDRLGLVLGRLLAYGSHLYEQMKCEFTAAA